MIYYVPPTVSISAAILLVVGGITRYLPSWFE